MKDNFWTFFFLTLIIALIAFDGRFEMVAGAVWILCLVEHLAQSIRSVAAPLRELADFANESKNR